ncbi:hypothetical protein DNTS_018381 [Danionella cerebrum]|uniref:CTNNB1 binding N-teminal domain-containing protein n=1 Tax=Danionella cerebrum TaxID=2873325 RepID=A0A553Q3C0_9TELE|nr:hypothetical protein DNTS_018381 [Danionella translucida]
MGSLTILSSVSNLFLPETFREDLPETLEQMQNSKRSYLSYASPHTSVPKSVFVGEAESLAQGKERWWLQRERRNSERKQRRKGILSTDAVGFEDCLITRVDFQAHLQEEPEPPLHCFDWGRCWFLTFLQCIFSQCINKEELMQHTGPDTPHLKVTSGCDNPSVQKKEVAVPSVRCFIVCAPLLATHQSRSDRVSGADVKSSPNICRQWKLDYTHLCQSQCRKSKRKAYRCHITKKTKDEEKYEEAQGVIFRDCDYPQTIKAAVVCGREGGREKEREGGGRLEKNPPSRPLNCQSRIGPFDLRSSEARCYFEAPHSEVSSVARARTRTTDLREGPAGREHRLQTPGKWYRMPQLNSNGDDLGATDEMIAFKDEGGDHEEKIRGGALTESDLADLKTSLVHESESAQGNAHSAVIRRGQQDDQRIYSNKREHLDDVSKQHADGGVYKAQYPGYPFLMLPEPYLPNGPVSPSRKSKSLSTRRESILFATLVAYAQFWITQD